MPGKPKDTLTVAKIIADHNNLMIREENDETEFDAGPDLSTNRGNKLKRKAPWAHEGRLAGSNPLKKRINHAGFDRLVLHSLPRRYDEEGTLLDSEEEDEGADVDQAERDPYHDVNIQALLMPLTAASDLWRHPGMSHAYTNEALTDMVTQSRESLRKERKTLSLVKGLATKFRGDHNRAAASLLLSGNDVDLYSAEEILRGLPEITPSLQAEAKTPEPVIAVNVVEAEEAVANGGQEEGTQAEDVKMAEGDAEPPATINGVAEALTSTAEGPPVNSIEETQAIAESDEKLDPEKAKEDADGASPQIKGEANGDADPTNEGENPEQTNEGNGSPPPRMVTRGAAAAANGTSTHDHDPDKPRSTSPQTSLPAIHPAFLPPVSSIPNRDLGLPPWEAEETRKLINVFVQKQEEVVRGAEKLYDMFLKANKLRKTVYLWSRAEEHAGQMSDGEEWVDQEEWGLDQPLRKGKEEGEEDNQEEKKGKGRSRRNAA